MWDESFRLCDAVFLVSGMIVVWLFLTMTLVCLQFVTVVFPDHTYLLFLNSPWQWRYQFNHCKQFGPTASSGSNLFWHSDCNPEKLFENVNYEKKKSADEKSMQNYPACKLISCPISELYKG